MTEDALAQDLELIRSYCYRRDLATADPYDLWKTAPGLWVKTLFNASPKVGALPAAAFTLVDHFARPVLSPCYRLQEYPVVRAFAAMTLLNLMDLPGGQQDLLWARKHLEWLKENRCPGYAGACWGIGFRYPVAKGIVYEPTMPMVTNTPYGLEAMVYYSRLTGDQAYSEIIRSVLAYLDGHLCVMHEDGEGLALSYGPLRDRVVINAQTYAMHAYALLLPYLDAAEQNRVEARIFKLWNYVRTQQQNDGSWYYSPEGASFIDCFHSAIVLKNLVKTQRLLDLRAATETVEKGYAFLKAELYDPTTGLFRRFAKAPRPSLVRFDLYDNAEMLNLAVLLKDRPFAEALGARIPGWFTKGGTIYSQVDRFGFRRRPDALRWAVMPYLHARSCLLRLARGPQSGG